LNDQNKSKFEQNGEVYSDLRIPAWLVAIRRSVANA